MDITRGTRSGLTRSLKLSPAGRPSDSQMLAAQVLLGEMVKTDTGYESKDGSVIILETHARPVTASERYAAIRALNALDTEI